MKCVTGSNYFKFILGLIFLFISITTFADQSIDLSKQTVKCGNFKLSLQMNPNQVKKYCKVYDTDHDYNDGQQELKLEFWTDNPKLDLDCKFIDNKLKYCAIDD